MFKRRGLLLVVISLALAVGAAWVARNWIQSRLTADAAPANPMMPVVVAAMDVPFGTKIEARHLKTIDLPSSTPLSAHFDKVEDVVGQITVQKIVAGEIVLKERVADHASGNMLASVLKPDMRAVTVRVDDVVGVAGFLLPGNHVDVVASRLVNQRAEAQTVLRDLNVLAVDQTAAQDKDQPVVVRAVTLEVTPQQAEVLVKAREEGKIQLTLRNPLEPEPAKDELVAKEAPAKPSRHAARAEAPRPAGNGVTIIRGTIVHSSESTT